VAIDERLIFLEGKHVRLKVLDERDIHESGWVGWFNDEKLCMGTQHHYYTNTFDNQREFLAELNGTDKIQLGVVAKDNPENICGVVSLSNIDYLHRKAEIGHIVDGNLTKRNPAIIIESWMLMIKHGFDQLGLNKIYGGTLNEFVVSAMKSAFNFEIEGVQRNHVYKSGGFADVTLVAVFKDTVIFPDL